MAKPRTECPAIAELKTLLHDTLDALKPGWKLGTTREDKSRHTAGLAIDIMLHSKDAKEKMIADGLIVTFVRHHRTLKWFDLIYTDWDATGKAVYFQIPGSPLYSGPHLEKSGIDEETGKKHENHIHLDWCDYHLKAKDPDDVYDWPPEARGSGFSSALRPTLERLNAAIPAAAEVAAPPWLPGWWQVTWRGQTYYYWLDRLGYGSYTQIAPGSTALPIQHPDDRGRYVVTGGNILTILWSLTGSVETLQPASASDTDHLVGRWNGAEPLAAARL